MGSNRLHSCPFNVGFDSNGYRAGWGVGAGGQISSGHRGSASVGASELAHRGRSSDNDNNLKYERQEKVKFFWLEHFFEVLLPWFLADSCFLDV